MPKRICLPLILIILLMFSSACLPIGSPGTKGGAPGGSRSPGDNLLISAENAYNQGQYQAAADYYKQYLQAVPNPPNLESVLAAYAGASEKTGQLSVAASTYERLIREFPSGVQTRDARPRLAAVYLAAGDFRNAEGLSGTLITSEKDPTRLSSLRLTLAQSQWAQGRYAEACGNFLSALSGAYGSTKTQAQDGVLASLAKMDASSVEKVQRQYGQNFPGPEATYILTRLAVEAGDGERTIALAEYFAKYFSGHKLMPEVKALAQAAAAGDKLPPPAFGDSYDPRASVSSALAEQSAPVSMGSLSNISNVSVAVILPLSGDNASKYAQEIVSGLKLALNSHTAAGSVGLTMLDTRGSAEEAARLVGVAAADPKVMAIIGPFLSRESASAAQAANKAGIPLIAISQRPDLTNSGPNVFRLFLTPKHQAEAVARYSVRIQGHKALGIIYPDDNFGRPIRTYFENEIKRLGAQVTVAEGYGKETDWAALVSGLTGGKAARKVSSTYQAEVGFTALYLPDSVGMASQVLAQMAYHDVTKMQYLGSSLWVNREMLAGSSRYIQGAVIPVAYSELSQRPESQKFGSDFQNAFKRQPDQFAAYGYDAGLAVIKALGQGSSSREAVRRALSQSGPLPGATGPFAFDRNGEYVVEPTILSVKGREFIVLREAAQGVR